MTKFKEEAYAVPNLPGPGRPVLFNSDICNGCNRCVDICPFDAIHLRPSSQWTYTAEVLRYNCVGCGGCVGRCPVTALDMPYFSNRLLDEIVSGVLEGAR